MLSTANPQKHSLGAGSLQFEFLDENDQPAGGYHPFGNCSQFALSTTVEEISTKDDTDGARQIAAKDVIGSETEITIQYKEFRDILVAMSALGEVATLSQQEAAITDQALDAGQAIAHDRWYDLGGMKITGITVEQGAAGAETPLAETTGGVANWVVDPDGMQIIFPSTGQAALLRTIFSGSKPGLSGVQIHGLMNAGKRGRLRFVSATNQQRGPRWRLDVHKIALRPDGELAFINQDYAEVTLRGTPERDLTQPVGVSQFYTKIRLDSLEETGS